MKWHVNVGKGIYNNQIIILSKLKKGESWTCKCQQSISSFGIQSTLRSSYHYQNGGMQMSCCCTTPTMYPLHLINQKERNENKSDSQKGKNQNRNSIPLRSTSRSSHYSPLPLKIEMHRNLLCSSNHEPFLWSQPPCLLLHDPPHSITSQKASKVEFLTIQHPDFKPGPPSSSRYNSSQTHPLHYLKPLQVQ